MADNVWIQTARVVSPAREGSAPAVQEEVVQLFGELRVPLLRYLHGLGLPACDGEDTAQDTFLALYRHLRDGKPRGNLRAWIFRVARNLALKRIQQAIGLRHFDQDCASTPDLSANPEEQAVKSQRDRATCAVLRVLPPLDRQCLQLKAAGLRYREIAEILDISLGSVAASVSRSLSRIARATEPEK
jgi:RNA polymerase sigma-70 factor (ECF subfamily)